MQYCNIKEAYSNTFNNFEYEQEPERVTQEEYNDNTVISSPNTNSYGCINCDEHKRRNEKDNMIIILLILILIILLTK